jgi:ADP-ribosyl-[dinitrogen reductase] hydrolase
MRATSLTHPIRVDVLPVEGLSGRLGLTFAPGKRISSTISRVTWDRDLDIDLQALRTEFGTDVLVPLIEDHEFVLLGIPELVPRAEALGMRVRRFSIVDVSVPVPDQDVAFRALIDDLHALLIGGQNVTVHCRGGLGRTGLVAASVLVRHGVEAVDAVARVRAVRPGAIETRAQERYVEAYAAARSAGAASSESV